MADYDFIREIIRCPNCTRATLQSGANSENFKCLECGSKFGVTFGRPVLLRSDNDLFDAASYSEASTQPAIRTKPWFSRLIPEASVNLANKHVFAKLSDLLGKLSNPAVLIVGGGQQRQWLEDQLAADGRARRVYTDIDTSADVDVFCDGHDLPFLDGSFDAVITTAVLEHVLYPERVAAEIARVLKIGGLLYSELPFMQQVHEGAYDFTRYTLSGHRRLFNRFAEIDSGLVAGPGTALVWAIENFFLAFFARPLVRKIAKALSRIAFGWIKYFDYITKNNPAALDGASCTYFFGRKINGNISDSVIIAGYSGAKHLQHTQ